ncbi:MAG TPA: class I SAM-dependent methyltransferase [Acidobacteriota bacterium]|nr:class I SAM-dependent methyltransferase [Acidobacteriota bacterium]
MSNQVEELAYIKSLKGVFRDANEHELYIRDGWKRIQVVLDLLTDLKKEGVQKVLELGSNPYLLTILMMQRFNFDLHLANFFGDDVNGIHHTHSAEVDGKPIEFQYSHFNIERDPFPFEDASFDCVIFCEILEHLLLNPDQAVAEIARITKPNGFVIISTPNATRLPNLYFLALGRNIYDWYSANGAYGRHNREYTLKEVIDLMQRHGFKVYRSHVQNIQPLARRFTYLQKLRPEIWYEHLFVIGRKT